jgi:O-antigen ligase
MEAKHVIALIALSVILPIAAKIASRRPALRDACVVLLTCGILQCGLVSMSMFTRMQYRGSTRAIEINWLDLLCVVVFASEPSHSGRRARVPPGLPMMLAFLAFNVLSVLTSTPRIFGLFELWSMSKAIFLFVTIAWYVKSDHELRVIAWTLCAAVSYEFFAALHTKIYFERAFGTFPHPNSLSMYNLIAVPLLLALALSDVDLWLRRAAGLSAVLGSLSVVLTISRNGLATLAVLLLGIGMTCGSFKITLKNVAIALVLAITTGVVAAATTSSFERRFAEQESEYNGAVYEGRGAYLILAHNIVSEEPRGCGLNNWSWCVSNRFAISIDMHHLSYPDSYPESGEPFVNGSVGPDSHVDNPQAPPAHSLYAITLGETGWLGVIVFSLVWLRWFQVTGNFFWHRDASLRSRFGVGAFFGVLGAFSQSLTEWEYRQTALLYILHLVLGAAAATHPARPSGRPLGRVG